MPAFTLSGTPTFDAAGFVTIDSTDSDRVTGDAAEFNESQGWVAFCNRLRWPGGGGGQHRFWSWRDSNANGLEVQVDDTVALLTCLIAGIGSNAQIGYDATHAAEVNHVWVGAWTQTTAAISLDGSALGTNTVARAGVVPIASSIFDIGRYSPSAIQWMDGDLWWIAGGWGKLTSGVDDATFNGYGTAGPATVDEMPGNPQWLWQCLDENYMVRSDAAGWSGRPSEPFGPF